MIKSKTSRYAFINYGSLKTFWVHFSYFNAGFIIFNKNTELWEEVSCDVCYISEKGNNSSSFLSSLVQS